MTLLYTTNNAVAFARMASAFQTFARIRGQEQVCNFAEPIAIAVADIQLFGSPEEVHHVMAWKEAIDKEHTAWTDELDKLVELLRRNLRSVLQLDPIKTQVWHVNIGPPKAIEEIAGGK